MDEFFRSLWGRARSEKQRPYQKELSLYPMSFDQAIDMVLNHHRAKRKPHNRNKAQEHVRSSGTA